MITKPIEASVSAINDRLTKSRTSDILREDGKNCNQLFKELADRRDRNWRPRGYFFQKLSTTSNINDIKTSSNTVQTGSGSVNVETASNRTHTAVVCKAPNMTQLMSFCINHGESDPKKIAQFGVELFSGNSDTYINQEDLNKKQPAQKKASK